MLVPLSWLREAVDLPAGISPAELDEAFTNLGVEVESVTDLAASVRGPLVVGRVLTIEELTGFKKPIRYCTVDVGAANGTGEPQSIVCGARNFAVDDLVVVILPGGVLPGEFTIGARKTYGRMSAGMICSARELGLGEDHSGIIVLPADVAAAPGDDARPVVGLDDVVFDLSVTPDRGYQLSVRGLGRELARALGVAYHDPADRPATAGTPDASAGRRILVEDTAGCDRFSARLVTGVDPAAPSPQWMVRRLTHAGVRPISLPVDVTNYVMLELGQPMHAFDAARLTGDLVVRRAREGERLTAIDHVERALSTEDLVICDDTGVVSLAAVMGGETTEVGDGTTDVLFEAAHWDPASISRTARRHRMLSEASKRYERGVDPALTLVALQRAVDLLVEYGGGTAGAAVVDVDHVVPAETVLLPADLPSRVAGVDYPVARVVELVEAVGATVAVDGDVLAVTPPSWRPDLTDPADVVEEVVRLDGYGNVPSVLPPVVAGNGLTVAQRRRRSVARALAEAGYVEVLSYPFVSPESFDALGLPADDPRRTAVRLANPLSEREPLLRTTLLPPLLATVRRNLARGQRDVALFEVGLVFRPSAEPVAPPPVLPVDHRPSDADLVAALAVVPRQPYRVAAVITGEAERAGWWGTGRAADWTDALEAARLVARTAGVTLTVRADRHAPWHPGRCAELTVDGVLVGHAGELHPEVCQALELPRGTAALEMELSALPDREPVPAPVISTYPPALIDVALLVDDATPAGDVESALAAGAGELLESIRLFDVFRGEQLGAGRKSLAYKLSFRAADRTLTADDAVGARDAAVAEAARRVGATLRGA
ncbi:phenylalanine--tRNA ligase subunit beta [Actinocatenispora rupis]|uniref:Phenylalanine--tRNA ligase beta subunit n=1 Tax=Actinocatenispora rupis TaxID=519421 RepID=A0A8J3JAC2_9ACTN|nr:phenylalanine--tRNA ligase subunit beta [Actinocatenispora rupis]GID11148.1 phenylalanine--tRNA ligase beta subunit [Actinocatenispora rupis]